MANISKSKTLFFVTSPRSPMKLRPEIKLLVDNFTGRKFDKSTQLDYAELLKNSSFFEGSASGDSDFSARDRITRAPKALGFVDLNPISLTDAGKQFLDDEMAEEALLRQLLKFQLPSPFHKESAGVKGIFYVRPYLELFRLINDLGKVTFDEMELFGMQLTDYRKYDKVKNDILEYRIKMKNHAGSYKEFKENCHSDIIKEVYAEDIKYGKTKTRESKDESLNKFIATKKSNMRDYTDACFRNLRSTGLASISQKGRSIYITPEKQKEVEFFLRNEQREPVFINDEKQYKKYLYDSKLPVLDTDNKPYLISELTRRNAANGRNLESMSIAELKKALKVVIAHDRDEIIREQEKRIKSFKDYADVMNVYKDIKDKQVYDAPLMLEWNTWRAMTMLDGGDIHANLKFDDNGEPMATAAGNASDIVCDYGDFSLSVEVTMQSGQRQYETEGEPVSRHLANLKKTKNKDAYCFFIAPKINDSCIAFFYMLHKTNIDFYGGKSVILPIELDVFEKMVEGSKTSKYVPEPSNIKKLCEYSLSVAENTDSEKDWYDKLKEKEIEWLAA